MSRYCRDCRHALVVGLSLGEPMCRCALGHWGPESWACALVAPACADFVAAAEEPGALAFWGLQPGCGLEPEPRRRRKARAEDIMRRLLTPTAA